MIAVAVEYRPASPRKNQTSDQSTEPTPTVRASSRMCESPSRRSIFTKLETTLPSPNHAARTKPAAIAPTSESTKPEPNNAPPPKFPSSLGKLKRSELRKATKTTSSAAAQIATITALPALLFALTSVTNSSRYFPFDKNAVRIL